ncbi:MAG: polysaccharide deacetylase family protein [Gemmatimonadetes bacterium]|nr:polysaccharide deacetylase family protein [Gemmatimonadota bacterium]
MTDATLFGVGTVLAAGAVAHGALYRNSPLFGRALGRLPGAERAVALTFDDGPNPETTPRVLDALRDAGVHATFFLLGRHVDRWPDLARRAADEGHELGNHGWAHRKLHLRTPSYVRRDLAEGTAAVERATGRSPRFFRAPHGFRSPWVNPVAASLGQRVVGWTLGVWDSDRPGAGEIARRAVTGTRAGTILLLHDGDGYDPAGDRTQTAAALPQIIAGLRDRGFAFVTLGDVA